MSYWNGAEWVSETALRPTSESKRAKWPATLVMIVGLMALMIPTQFAMAGSRPGPSLSTSCASACAVGASLNVKGHGFTPSAGGQQVTLWVEYPDDYCGTNGCHGFYYDPWVSADGTFDVTLDNATLGAGEGGVAAHQWNAKTHKWADVAYVDYLAK